MPGTLRFEANDDMHEKSVIAYRTLTRPASAVLVPKAVGGIKEHLCLAYVSTRFTCTHTIVLRGSST